MYAIKQEKTIEEFDKHLDEWYGEVDVAGMKYSTSEVLKEIDPTAYDVEFADWEADGDEVWECGECGETFDNEVDAEECCEDVKSEAEGDRGKMD